MHLPFLLLFPPALSLLGSTNCHAHALADTGYGQLQTEQGGNTQIILQMAPGPESDSVRLLTDNGDEFIVGEEKTEHESEDEEDDSLSFDGEVDSRDGNRCGRRHGTCPSGLCCSAEGRCYNNFDSCASPDCQIEFSDSCDALRLIPGGPDTSEVPRPHVGQVPYGGVAIYGCKAPKTVALTYDDGPNIYTKDLLNTLDQFEAKATFFLTGMNSGKGMIDDPAYPWSDIITRMYRSGHQIASHTWSHQNLDKVSARHRRDQILHMEAALRNILGIFPTYMRPPYSDCSAKSGCVADIDQLGYHVVYFDVDTADYRCNTPTKIQKSKDIFIAALNKAQRTDEPLLVIGHDIHEQTVYSLTPFMLENLRAAGYRAVTVGECLGDPEANWYRGQPKYPKVIPGDTPPATPDNPDEPEDGQPDKDANTPKEPSPMLPDEDKGKGDPVDGQVPEAPGQKPVEDELVPAKPPSAPAKEGKSDDPDKGDMGKGVDGDTPEKQPKKDSSAPVTPSPEPPKKTTDDDKEDKEKGKKQPDVSPLPKRPDWQPSFPKWPATDDLPRLPTFPMEPVSRYPLPEKRVRKPVTKPGESDAGLRQPFDPLPTGTKTHTKAPAKNDYREGKPNMPPLNPIQGQAPTMPPIPIVPGFPGDGRAPSRTLTPEPVLPERASFAGKGRQDGAKEALQPVVSIAANPPTILTRQQTSASTKGINVHKVALSNGIAIPPVNDTKRLAKIMAEDATSGAAHMFSFPFHIYLR